MRLLKVAIPPDAMAVVLPVRPEGVDAMVTDALELVTRLPPESWTCTTAVKELPAVVLEGGCVVKVSFVAPPGVLVSPKFTDGAPVAEATTL